MRDRLAIVGDFIFHLDDPNHLESQTFHRLLNVHELNQHFNGATHHAGHTLDVVLVTRGNNEILHGSPCIV